MTFALAVQPRAIVNGTTIFLSIQKLSRRVNSECNQPPKRDDRIFPTPHRSTRPEWRVPARTLGRQIGLTIPPNVPAWVDRVFLLEQTRCVTRYFAPLAA